ncbi:MAG: calcium/sodium antiporter [Bacteroidales bacterium]|nr:calcium/sodium antiporter [Bacteroidales bacterium]
MQILLLILGLALIVFGADWLVDGSSAIARKAGISEFVIGLTIDGFGTSCPELVVSLNGALQGNADISVGNVIGSNIFNTLLILGMTAAIAPVMMTRENSRRDIPIALLVTFLFAFLAVAGGSISRWEGIFFLVLFAAYIFFCFKTDSGESTGEPEVRERSVWLAILLVLAGLGGLIVGGRLFVNNATAIASALGVSDKFIAITLLAGGTSLPELATCIVAAIKKKDQLALGNVLGSNVFNILLILGTSSVIVPLSTASINLVDYGVLLLSIVLVWLATYTGRRNRIDRWEAVVMLLCFIAYYVWLFIKL